MTYQLHHNKHGVRYLGGPRVVGEHRDVWDHWETLPVTTKPYGPATCSCHACGAEWAEGAEHPVPCGAA